MIGEIRSKDTMEYAVTFAETGHLCLATLHANNANQALDRIINFFPEERRNQLLLDLSLNLRAFVSQRLVPTVDGKRCAAIEVLMGTPRVADLILRGQIDGIKEVMEKSEGSGMKTFDSALFELFMEGLISEDEALRNADSPNNVRLKIKFATEGGDLTPPSGPLASGPAESAPESAAEPALESSEVPEESIEVHEEPADTLKSPPPTCGSSMDFSLEVLDEEEEDRIF